MAAPFALVVGLGNPGDRYGETRHNAGFWFLDDLARRFGCEFRPAKRFFGLLADCTGSAGRLRLLKPQTYVNRSGQSVAAAVRFYDIPEETVLVAHDEIDLPAGTVRLKRGGGHGGHNGLRDIIAALGSREFARLRIGVGHPGLSDEVVDHVLRRPSKTERQLIEESLDRVHGQLPEILSGDLERAMQVLHSRREADGGDA